MAKTSFLAKRFPFFGNRAMLVLCAVFFLLPFALRGARMAVESMKNDVADWLPGDYEETADLGWFRENFVGDQFVLVSWPGCTATDSKTDRFVEKVREESVDGQAEMNLTAEEIRAHEVGDQYALHTTGSFHEDWGAHREKWLMGRDGQWFYINQLGELYKWDGQNNIFDGMKRGFSRFFNGQNNASGKFVDRFGEAPSEENGFAPNPYYKEPSKLYARFFKRIFTGPEMFDLLAGKDGILKTGDYAETDEETFAVEMEAHRRLEGWLFGPTPPMDFKWTWESLKENVNEEKALQLDKKRQEEFEFFVQEILDAPEFEGDLQKFVADTSKDRKRELWYLLWRRLKLEPPARQTCVLIYLNEPVLGELARAVGRPLLGKPRGRIHELASGRCGIAPENVRIGGPPVDNVAIDEEGSITLLKLVSLSAAIGIGLAYLSFRSFKVTIMLFFCGGVSAMSSLALVHYAGSTMDAILMSMPSLIYVLGLSGAVHIVNYYREACHEDGEDGAAERAIRLGWFPCTLAAFTTGLGLISLYTSNLTPINKFGFFSALATMATVLFMLSYLPAALHIWRPGYKQRTAKERGTESFVALKVAAFWRRVCDIVIVRHKIVTVAGIGLLIFFGFGVSRIETSVQLLKLFDKDAKILHDYAWLEENLGSLVPMEVVLSVSPSAIKHRPPELIGEAEDSKKAGDDNETVGKNEQPKLAESGQEPQVKPLSDEERLDSDYRYSFLERSELSKRVRENLELAFGPQGQGIVGAGMSADVLMPLFTVEDQLSKEILNVSPRDTISNQFEKHRPELLKESDSLRLDKDGSELWRISIRVDALNNVDYGRFVNDLKTVVEPTLAAYSTRNKVLTTIQQQQGLASLKSGRILVLGTMPQARGKEDDSRVSLLNEAGQIRQNIVFANTFRDLLENQGYEPLSRRGERKSYICLDPEKAAERQKDPEKWKAFVEYFDFVVILDQEDQFDADFIRASLRGRKNARNPAIPRKDGVLISAYDYRFEIDEDKKLPRPDSMTAAQRKEAGEEDFSITATYTGIVPIVYKAQRALLQSLVESICLAFVMIAFVMMLLLANWRQRESFSDYLNIPGGLLSMLPNIFPVVIIFGAMGHLGIAVDIGSMMTASVAMGVAVDDTIHFLNWYRYGLSRGMDRISAIKIAYDRVATAMTQTTLIGGFGLSAFALSTFTPTQRFGVLMLFLLAAALIGDLIFLPAILAGPLGRFFGKPNKNARKGTNGSAESGLHSESSEATMENSNSISNTSAASKLVSEDNKGSSSRTDQAAGGLSNHLGDSINRATGGLTD